MVNITPVPQPVSKEVLAKVAEERETLRRRHGVRLVSGPEEGESLKYLKGGFYGFTFAPTSLECGLMSKWAYLNFEIHKLGDNSVRILAVVTPDMKKKIDAAQDTCEIEFFPDAYSDASEMIVLPFENLQHIKPPSRDRGNMIKAFYQPS